MTDIEEPKTRKKSSGWVKRNPKYIVTITNDEGRTTGYGPFSSFREMHGLMNYTKQQFQNVWMGRFDKKLKQKISVVKIPKETQETAPENTEKTA